MPSEKDEDHCDGWTKMLPDEAERKVLVLFPDGERPTFALGIVQLEALKAQYLAQNAQEGVEYLLKKLKETTTPG